MFEGYALEFLEITIQSKYFSFLPFLYCLAEIHIPSKNKRYVVYYLSEMEEEQLFLEYIANTYCMHAIFFNKGVEEQKKIYTLDVTRGPEHWLPMAQNLYLRKNILC